MGSIVYNILKKKNYKVVKTQSGPGCRTHQDAGGPVSQRAVGDVRVSGDPTDVCCAPVDVIRLVVEHQLEGGGGVEHVAADCVKNPLQTRGDHNIHRVNRQKKDRPESRIYYLHHNP